MKLRDAAITSVEARVVVPSLAANPSAFQWKTEIRTAVFHVGGRGGQKQSAWDPKWAETFGGTDDPDPAQRSRDFRPAAFIPQLNPFYCALPYNDLERGTTKPEAAILIPWFKAAFKQHGQSVCRDRWIAIRNRKNGRTAYAQWSDCGPQGGAQGGYVFGIERPNPKRPGGPALDVSPAVRDYLELGESGLTDWRFVEFQDVPSGPWRTYGENNPFVKQARSGGALTEPSEQQP